MKVQQGDIVKVKIRKYYGQNHSKLITLNAKVEAIGYEENAGKRHKPVIKIIRKWEII